MSFCVKFLEASASALVSSVALGIPESCAMSGLVGVVVIVVVQASAVGKFIVGLFGVGDKSSIVVVVVVVGDVKSKGLL